MAKFSTKGIDDFAGKMERIQDDMKWQAVQTIMQAGCDELVEGWKDSIRKHNHISRGRGEKHMLDAVEMADIKVSDKGFSAEVYPQGMSGHRITQAGKAFILHHGRQATQRGTKAIKGSGFVKEAEKTAKPKVIEAMQNALNEIVGKE